MQSSCERHTAAAYPFQGRNMQVVWSTPWLRDDMCCALQPAGLQYCAQCCSTLPAVSFHFPCDTRSGLSHYCKACCSMSTLQMLQRRSGSQLQAESKVCSRCLASLPASSFYVSRSAASGLHSQCKGCFLQSYKERRQQKAP